MSFSWTDWKERIQELLGTNDPKSMFHSGSFMTVIFFSLFDLCTFFSFNVFFLFFFQMYWDLSNSFKHAKLLSELCLRH